MLGLSLLLNACQLFQPAPSIHHGPEIFWDTWGVPHIVARKDSDAFFAFGWAQMRSHGDLLLKLYAVARGRGAEIFDESYLPADRSVRLLAIPALAEKWYTAQEPAFRANLDAFAAGINEFARRHPETISDTVKAVLPVTPQDVIAHTTRVMTVFIAGTSECGAVLPGFDFSDQPVASNGWAIGPQYSASGHAMLLTNPHLDWRGLETFYEAHFLLPEVNLYGTALVGSPVLQIAFNDRLGWTHTVNTMDGCDLYRLKLAGAALEDGYVLDGMTELFAVTTEMIRIRRQDGSMTSEPLRIYRARQGPVVTLDDQVLAVRFALLETSLLAGMNQQWWKMGQARHFAEFQQILQDLHLPLFNVVYADADKHIMLSFNGIIPVRDKGDVTFWQAPVPGDDSSLIWTEIHRYADLPKSIDPANGWVQNANGAPWYMTLPFLDKTRYPPNIAADVTNARELRGLQILNEHNKMHYADLLAAKHSTRSLVADRLLDELIAAARISGHPLLKQAAHVLDQWDRHFLAESQGGWLFYTWFRKWVKRTIKKTTAENPSYRFTPDQLVGSLFYTHPFDPAFPLHTPRGLADMSLAIHALEEAAIELDAKFGALDVAWGDSARLRRGQVDLPGNGAPTALGVFREIFYEEDADGKFKSTSGDTYIALVEFSQPVRAQVLTTYGNATQNGFFEIGDQLRLAANQQLRPAWRTLDEIETNLMMRERLRHDP
ncbi:conserved hypothetical protein [Nitrosomonas nitrosa]|uniref:Acyl-homoserine-lactone acylase n=2 Tax=Nitrosomonas nitrosa TaxID=52442 RepID=A0A8H9DBB1_9PROT|nr:conserved hypothetical protein [Nitrosomonas nitrosa]